MPEAPLRILLVDDEAPARHRLRELLDDCAAVLPISIVGEAQHGREALDILHSASADLVLTDIHMPAMDGIELARHLLKLSHPPVVIFTTAFHEHALAAFEVHAVDYLVKPVRVHRNCLVARDFIRGFERRANDDGDAHWEVLLHGIGETLPVSRRQQYIVREIGREVMNGAAA